MQVHSAVDGDFSYNLGQDCLEAGLGLATGLADRHLHLNDVVPAGALHMVAIAAGNRYVHRWQVDALCVGDEVHTGVLMVLYCSALAARNNEACITWIATLEVVLSVTVDG